MFRRAEDNHFSGYGDLVKIENNDEITVTCIDADYEVDFTSSSETVTAGICSLADQEDGSKKLAVSIPENLEEAVVISMYRPGYQSAKFFTGGGWADGESHNIEEAAIDQLTNEDMDHLEETVLGKVDENDDEYRLLIAGGEIDLCCKCSDRFKKFWNEFFRPDPFSEIPPFKPNEKMMYKSVTGEVIN